MKILIANLGSTSLKYRLFDFSKVNPVVAKGGFERVVDHRIAIDDCLKELGEKGISAGELAAVGFKAVLAKGLTGCVRLDDSVLKAMEAVRGLAPAHNPAYLQGIRIFSERMPEIPMIALFETAFYQWMPEVAKRYAVPENWYVEGVRRWGFHGASHKYIAERSAKLLGREDVAHRVRWLYANDKRTKTKDPKLRIISCHLGGSSSISAIVDGIAIGNSMGMSPQSGLAHNNRVGDLDAFSVLHMIRQKGLSADEVENALCNESGLKGLSGGFGDLRDICNEARLGNEKAQLALDFLIYETRRWIGSYLIMLDGLDALVFTGGIGEHQSQIRAHICMNLEAFGINLDATKNESFDGKEAEISSINSRVKVFVISANEEWVVANEVRRFLENESLERKSNGKSSDWDD